jgi:two-component system alkaline phosphatase synthesis response regulator PhoP
MHITIIEDEKLLSKNLEKKLIKNWFNTTIYNWYIEFINSNFQKSDLYIIDLSLIDWSWYDIIKKLREKNIKSPIIITSWYSDPDKKIYWLDLWADDYISKPFSSEELIARIRALLRRSYSDSLDSNINYNNINYDTKSKSVYIDWKKIELRWREIKLIEYMLFNIWKLIKKDELIISVWWEYDITQITDNNINVTMSNVRKKLWANFKLKTIAWQWYILEENN